MAEHASQSMDSALRVLDRMSASVRGMNLPTPDDLRRRAASEAVHTSLRDLISGLPQIQVALIADDKGRVIVFSRSFPAPEINIGDRDYFQAHTLAREENLARFISKPVRNRVNGE